MSAAAANQRTDGRRRRGGETIDFNAVKGGKRDEGRRK